MPPKFSKHGRTDHSASADYTPRGFRSPRGNRPHHTPRGGNPDRRQSRDTRTYESRSRVIDDAFGAPLDSVQSNSRIFAECISQVLRKQSGIKTKEDHDSALADSHFETMSRHLSYIFRHTKLMHRDGSLSLHESLLAILAQPEKFALCTVKDRNFCKILTLMSFQCRSDVEKTLLLSLCPWPT